MILKDSFAVSKEKWAALAKTLRKSNENAVMVPVVRRKVSHQRATTSEPS